MLTLFDRVRIEENCEWVAGSATRPAPVRLRFARGIQSLMGTPLEIRPDQPALTFGRQEWFDFLLERQVVSTGQRENAIKISQDVCNRVCDKWSGMREFLERVSPDALELLDLLIAEVTIFQIERPEAGSHSAAIGFIWLNTNCIKSPEYLAELVFHEVLHNIVFLEDMVRGLMPDMELLEREDTRAYSAVRMTSRYFDSAFHAAFVAAGMMWFHHHCAEHEFSSHAAQIDHLLKHGRLAVTDLIRVTRQQATAGRPILTSNGDAALAGMADFFQSPDFDAVDLGIAKSISFSAS